MLSTATLALAVSALALLASAGPAAASTTRLSMFEIPGIEGTPASPLEVSITAGAPFVYVTTGLRRKLERRARRNTVTFTLLITDANGASTTIPLKLRVK